MPNCTAVTELFPEIGRRKIELNFDGGDISSDGGVLLLGQVDRKLELLSRIAPLLPDERDPERIEHTTLELLRQRVYEIVQGNEDLNDHQRRRIDPALQTALGKVDVAASAPTLCRFEQRATAALTWKIQAEFVRQFIASHRKPPAELILDFDASDIPLHGNQEERFFHGYYDNYCYLPLYVFCGDQLLVSYLRPSKLDAAKHAGAILKWLTGQLRAAWPDVRIIFRGDSGFCRRRILHWCERKGVDYVVGLAQNARLKAMAAPLMAQAEAGFNETGMKQRLFDHFEYAAKSWCHTRRVIAKAEHTALGSNPRFILTTLAGDPQQLYDRLYCSRGEMENRIKECQLGLFGTRLSGHRFVVNQFRLLLASMAYILLERMRTLGLAGTALASAQAQTLRVKLLKVGTVIIRNTRRIRFFLSSSFVHREEFMKIARHFASG
jgi:hypothetical protein